MVIEAGVVAGYVIAWAVRKARRVGGRLDKETDGVIDASLDRLHEIVTAKLGGHPALAEMVEEAEAAGDGGEVSDLTRQQVELALTAAARKDDAFGEAVMELVKRVRDAEQATGSPVNAGSGSAVFTGNAEVKAGNGGFVFGQVAGDVHISQGAVAPSRPGLPTVAVSAYASDKAIASGAFRYESRREQGRLLIEPRDAYLDAIRGSGELTPQQYWYSMWRNSFAWPALDVKITNNTAQTVFFSEAQFRVTDSRADLRPVPVIHGIVYLTQRIHLPLANVGWGPMEDCMFRFHLERPDDATPLTADISWPLGGNGQTEDLEPFIAALAEAGTDVSHVQQGLFGLRYEVPPDWERALGPFTSGIVIASGSLEYTQANLDGTRTRQRHPMTAVFSFGPVPRGLPRPPSWTYQVKLRTQGHDYHIAVPISQALSAGEADRFLLTIAAEQSSQHDFTLTLLYNGTEELNCGSVTLDLFIPTDIAQRMKSETHEHDG